MVNPLIIAKGAQALGAATKGAAAGAAKIAASEKAAKALSGAFKSIEETTKMGGFQALENFSENIKNSKPVAESFQLLGALFSSETMGSRTALMKTLIDLFTSDGFGFIMGAVAEIFNGIINNFGNIIEVLDKWITLLGLGDPGQIPEEIELGGGGGEYMVWSRATGWYDINAAISQAIYDAAIAAGGQIPLF